MSMREEHGLAYKGVYDLYEKQSLCVSALF